MKKYASDCDVHCKLLNLEMKQVYTYKGGKLLEESSLFYLCTNRHAMVRELLAL